jgi:hypothetical protein
MCRVPVATFAAYWLSSTASSSLASAGSASSPAAASFAASLATGAATGTGLEGTGGVSAAALAEDICCLKQPSPI